MLRLVAAILVVVSGGGLGIAAAEGFRRRPSQLRQLRFALTVLASEIRFRQTPLPQGLQVMAMAAGEPLGQLFSDLVQAMGRAQGRSLSWAWQQVEPGPDLSLAPQDYALLENLVQVLGTGTIFEQERQLELHQEHLRQLEQEAEQARATNEKVWRYLGLFSGLAMALLLL